MSREDGVDGVTSEDGVNSSVCFPVVISVEYSWPNAIMSISPFVCMNCKIVLL